MILASELTEPKATPWGVAVVRGPYAEGDLMMRQSEHDARMAAIDRALAENARARRIDSVAHHLLIFVFAFVAPCIAMGAGLVALTIFLTKTYLM